MLSNVGTRAHSTWSTKKQNETVSQPCLQLREWFLAQKTCSAYIYRCCSHPQNLHKTATGCAGMSRCDFGCGEMLLMTKTAKESHEKFDNPTTKLNYRSLHLTESAQKHLHLSTISHHFDHNSSCNHFQTYSHAFMMCVWYFIAFFSVLTKLCTNTEEFYFQLKNHRKMSPESAVLCSHQMPCISVVET